MHCDGAIPGCPVGPYTKVTTVDVMTADRSHTIDSQLRRHGPRRGVRATLTTGVMVALAVVAVSLVAVSSPIDAETAVVGGPAAATSPAMRMSRSAVDGPPRLIGYFPSWGIYERNYQVADVPAGSITHLNYAFANVVDGRCVVGDRWADIERPQPTDDPSLDYRGNFNQLQVLKRSHPHLRTIISVGGSTWSGNFSEAASTAAKRRTFATSCVEFMHRYGFDGLSIDWEYPVSGGRTPGVPADRANFTALLSELRSHIDALDARTGGEHVLTVAGPAGAPTMANLEISRMAPLVDWVNVMTYDFAGSWSPRTGHNSPLYAYPGIEDATFSIDSAMRRWEAAGMPAAQLNVGLSFYGRGFGGVSRAEPGHPFASVPAGTTEPGQFDYSSLRAGALDRATVRFDATARVPYAYDAESKIWYSFDDPRSIEEKARYARVEGYGGVLVWELSNDVESDVLLRAAMRGLG